MSHWTGPKNAEEDIQDVLQSNSAPKYRSRLWNTNIYADKNQLKEIMLIWTSKKIVSFYIKHTNTENPDFISQWYSYIEAGCLLVDMAVICIISQATKDGGWREGNWTEWGKFQDPFPNPYVRLVPIKTCGFIISS